MQDYMPEGNAYQKVGQLETELAAARTQIGQLEGENRQWQGRVKWLAMFLLVTLVILLIAGIIMVVAGSHILFG